MTIPQLQYRDVGDKHWWDADMRLIALEAAEEPERVAEVIDSMLDGCVYASPHPKHKRAQQWRIKP